MLRTTREVIRNGSEVAPGTHNDRRKGSEVILRRIEIPNRIGVGRYCNAGKREVITERDRPCENAAAACAPEE
jgi:hypothetical protein